MRKSHTSYYEKNVEKLRNVATPHVRVEVGMHNFKHPAKKLLATPVVGITFRHTNVLKSIAEETDGAAMETLTLLKCMTK